ncbi:MAG TPA: efflux transporter outer membrane subunit [Acidobacteriota bacterium]|nr:efflux transporter outer membrane subunit [Acidobacteriota bacterium]
MIRVALAAALLVPGISCVSAPPTTQPTTDIAVPAEFGQPAAAESTGVRANWWNDFGEHGLAAAVDQALQYNTDLLAAAARVAGAEASARIAGADLGPQLGASALGTRRKQNFVGFPIPGNNDRVLSTTSTNYGVSLELSWEADLWGRLGAQAREGLANYQASEAEYAGALLSIAAQTTKAWFAVAEAQQQVALAERTVASFTRSSEQVRARFERGVRPALDLRLAMAQASAAGATLLARRQQVDAAGRQLQVLLGVYPGGEYEFPATLIGTPAPVPSGLPADLVARRPDLAAAERRLVAADQRLRGARAALYPRLSLTTSGGTSSNQLGDLVKGDFSVWSLIGNLVAPLLQGGRLRAGVDLAQAGIDEATATYVGTALRAYAEVESALAAETLLADQVRQLAAASEQSGSAERLAGERYRNGLEGYVTVLEAQRRTFDAESAVLSGHRQRLDNRVDLYLALGGGFHVERSRASTTSTPPELPSENQR